MFAPFLKAFDSGTPSLSFVKWAGHFFFIVYFGFAWYYFLERSTSFDAGLYLFKVIYNGSFNTEHGRWGVVYAQLLPLLAYKIGLPLKTFLLLYSLSYAIFNYLCFLALAYLFRNPAVSLAYLFALVIFCRYAFFFPVSEIHSTIGPLFLLAAGLYKLADSQRPSETAWYAVLTMLLVFWLSNTHIISMIPVGFLFVYVIIDRKLAVIRYWPVYFLFIAAIAFFMVKVSMIPKDGYQGSKLITPDAFKTVLTSLQDVACYPFFKKDISTNYTITLLFTGMAVLAMLLRKRFLKAAYILASLLGFWVIMMAYYVKPDCAFNYQNYYCYFGVIIALPLAGDLLLKFARPLLLLSVVTLFLFNYYRIMKTGLKMTDRTAYMQRTIQNLRHYKERKFILCEWNTPITAVLGSWDFSFESLILSSIEHPDSTITFFSRANMWEHDNFVATDPKCFLGLPFYLFEAHADTLQSPYFHPKEGLYRKVNILQDDPAFADSVFSKENIKLVMKDSYTLLRAESREIELEFINNSNVNFNTYVTNAKTIWLSYHLYDKTGKLLVKDGYRTNIELDVPPHASIRTGLNIDLHDLARGEYILEADIVHEYKRWYGINARTSLKIY